MISSHRFASDTDAPNDLRGIYRIVHVQTGRAYVGQTARKDKQGFAKRCQEHFYNATTGKAQHRNTHFGRCVRKYGADQFEFQVLQVIDPSQPNSVFDEAELAWIDATNSMRPNGFNIHRGPSPRGCVRSEETRRKMSESRKRMLAENPDFAVALRRWAAALGQSDAVRAAASGRPMSANTKAALSAFRADGAAVKAAVEKARATKIATGVYERQAEEGRARMSDPARRAVMSRRVACIETGIVYASVNEAARQIGVSKQAVTAQLNGRNPRCKGLTFRDEVPA